VSLKAFHIIFITASSALAFGFAVWAAKNFFGPQGTTSDLFIAIGAVLAGIALIVYGRYFLKKLKNISYL
jgi:hypothetical protein